MSRWRLCLIIVVLTAPLFASVHPVQAIDCVFAGPVGTMGCSYGLPSFQYEMILSEMLAHPNPDVRTVPVDPDEIRKFSLYRVVKENITFYDAPNGNAIGTLDAGFNFLSVRRQEGNWYEIRAGRWVQASMLTRTRASTFAGVLIDKPLTHTMAWILTPVQPSSVPGQEPEETTAVLPRYTRLNIYAAVQVGEWEWYLVGPGQWVEQRRLARVLAIEKPDGVKGRWVSIDLFEQVLVAYEDDRMVFATLIASGLPQWPTNEGLFRIWARMRTDGMSGAMGQPDFYYLESVPYVMYFDGAIGLHGAYWHDGFGYRRSHGCVNMSVSDSRWLYDWTGNFYGDTWVHVRSSGTYKK